MLNRLPTSPGLPPLRLPPEASTFCYMVNYRDQDGLNGQQICAELNLHKMGLTSQVSAPENLASSGDQLPTKSPTNRIDQTA